MFQRLLLVFHSDELGRIRLHQPRPAGTTSSDVGRWLMSPSVTLPTSIRLTGPFPVRGDYDEIGAPFGGLAQDRLQCRAVADDRAHTE